MESRGSVWFFVVWVEGPACGGVKVVSAGVDEGIVVGRVGNRFGSA